MPWPAGSDSLRPTNRRWILRSLNWGIPAQPQREGPGAQNRLGRYRRRHHSPCSHGGSPPPPECPPPQPFPLAKRQRFRAGCRARPEEQPPRDECPAQSGVRFHREWRPQRSRAAVGLRFLTRSHHRWVRLALHSRAPPPEQTPGRAVAGSPASHFPARPLSSVAPAVSIQERVQSPGTAQR